jgi:beta-phosphoglucomutase
MELASFVQNLSFLDSPPAGPAKAVTLGGYPMPGFEAVLFDFDGVLLDSEPIHCDCWREVLAPLGVRVTWDAYAAHCVGAADHQMMAVFAKLADPPADPARLWQEYDRKKQVFAERLRANPPFAHGLTEFFRDLAQSYKLAVVSSSARDEIEPLLSVAGIRDHLGTVVCGEDVERHKPWPDPYMLAGRRLGIQTALAVEDSVAGMQSAQAAGFESVRIANPARMMEAVRQRLGASGIGSK